MALSPDGHYLAMGSEDRTVRVFETATGKELSHLAQSGPVPTMALSSDGHYLATGSEDRTVRVFETTTGNELWRLPPSDYPSDKLDTLAFSPDGRYLALATTDHYRAMPYYRVHLFEAATGKPRANLQQEGSVHAVAFSPDGHYVATGSEDRTARVFEAATGKELSSLGENGPVHSVAFSPDGRYLATGSEDWSARVFETATGKELSYLAQKGPVQAVAFAPDGLDSGTSALVTSLRPLRPIPRYILTAQILTDPYPVVIVTRESLRLTDLIEQACSGLTRNLTSEEWKQYLGDTPRQRTCPNLQ